MPAAPHLDVVNVKGEAVKNFVLPAALLEQKIKPGLIHQVVVAYAANRRAGSLGAKKVPGEPDTVPLVHPFGRAAVWCLVRAAIVAMPRA